MQPIPTPEVLDPNRVLDNDRGDFTTDHEARAALLEDALHKSCDYAQQLWDTANAMRAYLMNSLPPDPRTPGPHPTTGASPTGPDDSEGWDRWTDAFAAVTSILCGPHGDSGYGLGEARHAAQLRRTAPNLNLAAHLSQTREPDAAHRPAPSGDQVRRRADSSASPRPLRLLAAGVVGVLALRGLRR
ncbi:MAG TPA: hypothetical protein VGN18_15660 [Jatrophihabitans sp.]|jgi:hypothetical protein|uniref:hypothetical protein n=1 Tax=Jatrophihabitans sp. TaxID=1932789 RepID=UPI002E06B5FE|nr:hypothetical protein [Jatrophihabitans sp.]